MAMMVRLFLFSFLMLGLSQNGYAASIDLFERDGYDRLVIEGGSGTVNEDTNGVLSFTTQTPLSQAAIQTIQSPAIQTITRDDAMVVVTPADVVDDVRYFKIGNRIIIDLFIDAADRNDGGDTQIQAQESSPLITETDMPDTPDGQDEIEPDDVVQAEPTAETAAPVEVQEEAPTMTALDMADSSIAQPTIVTVSSTAPISMAAFKRYGRLFIVSDTTQISQAPQISGAGQSLGWSFEEIDFSGGKAWMMPVPNRAYIRPEGGNLIWRLVISDQNPNMDSATIIRNFEDEDNPSLVIDMANTRKILKFTDPDYGDDLAVFTVPRAEHRMNEGYDFIDFDILPAAIGAVVKPQSDGVQVASNDSFITVSKANGLSMARTSQADIVRSMRQSGDETEGDAPPPLITDRVFFFEDWAQDVDIDNYIDLRHMLDKKLAEMKDDETDAPKIPVLFDLVKAHLAMNMGQEALGYLDIITDLDPNVSAIPDYHALKGAAHFLAAQYDLAIESLENDLVANNAEAMLWRASALLNQGESDEGMEVYQANADTALNYPYEIRLAVVAPIIQNMLNRDRGADALELLALFDDPQTPVSAENRATLYYLKGVGQKMTGYPEKAIENLQRAVNADRLGPYGAKSELELIQDELLREAVSVEDAIRRMERLRFVWRGDNLESEIYEALGQLYIQNNEGRRGLSLLKRAAEIAPTSVERRAIVRQMADLYREIFTGDSFDELEPMEAISVYDEFKELTPVGREGNLIIDRLADKLMEIDLMSRAVSVLQDKMVRLQGGQDAIKSGLRIAAIQLIDRKPEAAMDTLRKVDSMLARYDGDDKQTLNEKVILLKARSLADSGQSQSALFMMEGLDNTDDVLRLRVDTAWDAGDWTAVSDSLRQLIDRQNITLSEPPTSAQAQMILNQAIALNLSNQRQALQQFASEFDLLMKQTPVYNTFKIVTRPLNIAALADRQTLLDMTSEVDMFSAFLDDMRDDEEASTNQEQ